MSQLPGQQAELAAVVRLVGDEVRQEVDGAARVAVAARRAWNRVLTRLSRESGESVNTMALRMLEHAVGIDARRQRLRRYATWSEDDRVEFERALSDQRVIDDELWR